MKVSRVVQVKISGKFYLSVDEKNAQYCYDEVTNG
jgi:hypothetical protein